MQFLCACRNVRDLRWLAEATYTGEALEYTLNNTITYMTQKSKVVLVLTDGRSDIIRDKTPLTTLCGRNLQVRAIQLDSTFKCSYHPANLKISYIISRWVVWE